MNRSVIPILIFYSNFLFLQSCTEPFTPKTETFEDLLVVEATITNELKTQEIKLTRTYAFEEKKTASVKNAQVFVTDNSGNKYIFEYNEEKMQYLSVTKFQAIPEHKYTLHFTTKNGQSYISTTESLPEPKQFSINYKKKTVLGEYGVQISVDSYDPGSTSSHYYRYKYKETYKVVPPFWGPYKAVLTPAPDSISESGFIIQYEYREKDTRVCYSTRYSNKIMLTNTAGKSEDRIIDFPVRFISDENYILQYKYSILITQYVESYEAYIFYKTLKRVAGADGTALSPNQPGFVDGNLSSVNNLGKKIIGYFDVASVSSERIFLDYPSLFPNHTTPDYFNECEIRKLKTAPGQPDHYQLIGYINTGFFLLYKPVGPVFWMVPPVCTDCSTFSSTEKPAFWP